MYDFEKLGAFYLGKRVDTDANSLTDDLVLYDSRDLTTHAVIIGMTGSGKTGLGIGMLEEAALDHIPVIAIDPKGDLGNLLLTFPELRPEDFRPWINSRQAADQGITADEHAKAEAALWKKGLADWGQDGGRIAKLRESTEMAIYTPGSTAGLPVSVLQSFAAPANELVADVDLYRERIQATATGLLSLVGIDTDPVTSREHILLSKILDHNWEQARDLDVANTIAAIQKPPFDRVGVMALDSFYPSGDRFTLAMRLNNLLAAPGFEAWMQGDALSAAKLLYTDSGKPRISIMSIAHLAEAERMFFVSMLLNELIAWMRSQQGTTSLRAILYMDEIFGYMPPVANPPSKQLFLTLLKQARAYGLGLVLATQNPVDLDYKGLSNTGTWLIGRLQTERDKARVMEGLEGTTHGGRFDRQKMERTLAGLGKRQFLLHNVHEDEAVVFGTRWAMSYLAGPMTREQIKALMAGAERPGAAESKEESSNREATLPPAATAGGDAPLLPPSIRQFYLSAEGTAEGKGLVYHPRLLAAADIAFSSSRYGIEERRERLYTLEIEDNPVSVDWDNADPLRLAADKVTDKAAPAATFAECPSAAANAANYTQWEKRFGKWLRQNECIRLFKSERFRLTSNPEETEGEFRGRLQQAAAEERDQSIGKVRKRYATKTTTLENRLLRARQAIEREAGQSNEKRLDTAVSFGTAILGAVLGRKRLSASTASRVGSAIRSASGARKQASDVTRARETEQKVLADLRQLNSDLEAEVAALDTAYEAQAEALTEILIKPRTTDIHLPLFGLLWMPYRDAGDGKPEAAWKA
ncbi:MAG: DUF87 domain-containing protein [Woeseia sp.]